VVSLKVVFDALKEALKGVTEDYSFEAKEIVKSVFLVSNNDIILNREITLSDEQKSTLEDIVSKRKSNYPLQYILGSWDFFGREFSVGEGVLIPRADTEVVVEKALEYLERINSPKVLDLCSGSGCIAITLKLEKKDALVTAVEKSEKAFSYLVENVKKLGADVECILSDALELEMDENFDLVVSNPPYLTKEDMDSLQKEVSFEPRMALYGKEDGLFFYRELTRIYKGKIKKGGALVYEIGDGQHESVAGILSENGFQNICKVKDYNGIIRCVMGIKP